MQQRRITGIDNLRGLVMVLMTLDHARDFFGDTFYSATDLTVAAFPVFMTRWITHLCAPTFLFLAGCSIWFQVSGQPMEIVRKFLFSRGILLVVFELTFVHLVWYAHLEMHYAVAGVIWAIGWSMILFSWMLGAPRIVFLFAGASILVFQPALATLLHGSPWITLLLRTEDIVWLRDFHFYTSYPVLPWFAIGCIGYYLGPWFGRTDGDGRRKLLITALGAILLFGFLRFISTGDPEPPAHFETFWQTACSFVNLTKYPPSLDYTLLMLGLATLIFVGMEKLPPFLTAFLSTLGKAPLFYYLIHLLILHFLAVIYAGLVYGTVDFLLRGPEIFWYDHLPGHPEGYGGSLWIVYALTVIVVAMLLPITRVYANFKHQRPGAVWRFL